ncbi:MAG: pyruvate formate lyase family protein [Dehalococcoidia bacterium]|jgi:formate C-acetyltransferase
MDTKKRIEKLKGALDGKESVLCVEKGRLLTESYKQTDGEPPVLRRAKAFANVLNNVSIFIEDDELIVGNTASKPRGVEVEGTFPEEAIEAYRKDGWIISEQDAAEIRSIHEYWVGKTIWDTITKRIRDNETLASFKESGIRVPFTRQVGVMPMTGYGWDLGRETGVIPDYDKLLAHGLNSLVEEAEEELRNTRILNADAFEKVDFLKAAIISLKAIINFASRFSALATEMASKEKDPTRRKELERIAETCQRVPAKPARNFYEAMQSYWFITSTVLGTNTWWGRFDQHLYPFYKQDIKEGKINEEEALELLQCLRIKAMQLHPQGSPRRIEEAQLTWDQMVIGGQTPDGQDATNDLTYLVLEAAKRCPTPHPALSLRVHGGTPDALMMKAMELLKAGVNIPSFLGDYSAIDLLLNNGVPIRLARDYAMTACLEIAVVGRSRFFFASQFIVPLVLDFFLNNGIEPRTGKQLGPKIDVESYKSFDDLMLAFKGFLYYFIELGIQGRILAAGTQREQFPDPPASALSFNGIREGKDVFNRKMLFENGQGFNVISIINVVDSLAAIKKLVFDEKKVTMKKLKAALAADWQGYEDIRQMCLAAPKFGNDDDYVDSIAKEIYQFFAETVVKFDTVFGGKFKPASVAMSRWRDCEGAKNVGATPDGRYAGEALADESLSPIAGSDTHTPKAVLNSALKVDQVHWDSISFGMSLHPAVLETTEGMRKLSDLIKEFVIKGGRHIQFNVVSRDTLLDAQKNPERYSDLLVNMSTHHWAYFVQTPKDMQDRLIARTEYRELG